MPQTKPQFKRTKITQITFSEDNIIKLKFMTKIYNQNR